ncbi:MAG TPA: hypothetical protein VEP68_00295, partial [Anaeromyxobacteraceae bacterium]|nr:hypothetical protein [Anaeromyxobacteraceae bacterium]
MDFELSGAAREAEDRAAAMLAAEAAAVAALPDLDGPGLRRLLLSARRALPGRAGAEVAARLALARASPALLPIRLDYDRRTWFAVVALDS